MKITVLGLGNLLLGDEGLGVHALKQLGEQISHPVVDLIDGGTRGLLLLPFLEEATHLLIFDAVRSDDEIGSLIELSRQELLNRPPLKFSAHDVALPDLLSLLRLRREGELHGLRLVGLVPGPFTDSTRLSPELSAALPQMVERGRAVVEEWLGEVSLAN